MTEYAELISSTHKSFSIEDDIGAIARISTSLLQARQARLKRRQESKAAVNESARQLESINATKLVDNTDHSSTMNALDREKFALAKGINDLETATHHLSSTLLKLQHEVNAPEEVIPVHQDASVVLKLSVYRDLGITLLDDEKAIVTHEGDVKVVALGRPGERANELWSSS